MSHVDHTVYICSERAPHALGHHTIHIVLKGLALQSFRHHQTHSIGVAAKAVNRSYSDTGPALGFCTVHSLRAGIVQHGGVDDIGEDHSPSVPSAGGGD